MSSTTFKRPKRTNAPMQPRNRGNKMELKECITCGAHSFTNKKCDYCGNQYEVQNLYADDKSDMKVYSADGINSYAEREIFWRTEVTPFSEIETREVPKKPKNLPESEELGGFNFSQTEVGETTIKIMLIIFFSIIWFTVTVFIPPLFIITIVVLIILAVRKIIKKIKLNA